MNNPLHSSHETTTPSETASEPWTPPELQKLPVAETASTGSLTGDDGVFYS
jgi:hypothetical protein